MSFVELPLDLREGTRSAAVSCLLVVGGVHRGLAVLQGVDLLFQLFLLREQSALGWDRWRPAAPFRDRSTVKLDMSAPWPLPGSRTGSPRPEVIKDRVFRGQPLLRVVEGGGLLARS